MNSDSTPVKPSKRKECDLVGAGLTLAFFRDGGVKDRLIIQGVQR